MKVGAIGALAIALSAVQWTGTVQPVPRGGAADACSSCGCCDCDGSGDVTVDELIRMVDIALGVIPISACPAGSAECCQSDISEITFLVQCVVFALSDCPMPTGTPTSTPTPTPSPATTPTCISTPVCHPCYAAYCLGPFDVNGCPQFGCVCEGPTPVPTCSPGPRCEAPAQLVCNVSCSSDPFACTACHCQLPHPTPTPTPTPTPKSTPTCASSHVPGCCDFSGTQPQRSCFDLLGDTSPAQCASLGGRSRGCPEVVTCNFATGHCEPEVTPTPASSRGEQPFPLTTLDEACGDKSGAAVLASVRPEYDVTLRPKEYINQLSVNPVKIQVTYNGGTITCYPGFSQPPGTRIVSMLSRVGVVVTLQFFTPDGAFHEQFETEIKGRAGSVSFSYVTTPERLGGTYRPDLPGYQDVGIGIEGNFDGDQTNGVIAEFGTPGRGSEYIPVAQWATEPG